MLLTESLGVSEALKQVRLKFKGYKMLKREHAYQIKVCYFFFSVRLENTAASFSLDLTLF